MEPKDTSKYSIHNRKDLQQSERAGCYHCCQLFNADQIKEFVDKEQDTAICPKCGIDAVLSEKSGYELNLDTLELLRKYWFDSKKS